MQPEEHVVVPVVNEEVTADAIPVQTGGVRVVKHVERHEEVLEQELRKGRVEVKRVKTERVVNGPQPVERSGNKLIIPVVSEVLRIEKQWVVTEEIHLTQIEERETFRQAVPVKEENAVIEHLDEAGNVVSTDSAESSSGPLLNRRDAASAATVLPGRETRRRVLSSTNSLLRDRDKQAPNS